MADPSQFMALMDDLYGPDEVPLSAEQSTVQALLELVDRMDARQAQLEAQLTALHSQLSMLTSSMIQAVSLLAAPRVRTVTRDELGQITSVVDSAG